MIIKLVINSKIQIRKPLINKVTFKKAKAEI